jgi:histidine triad (HIT) family protein
MLVDDSCIFCRIANGRMPSDIVAREDDMVAFRDIDPMAPTHILIVPRTHIVSLNEAADDPSLPGRMMLLARSIARNEGIADGGYRLVLNTGAQGGQSVDHLHLHLMGGRALGWPPG